MQFFYNVLCVDNLTRSISWLLASFPYAKVSLWLIQPPSLDVQRFHAKILGSAQDWIIKIPGRSCDKRRVRVFKNR